MVFHFTHISKNAMQNSLSRLSRLIFLLSISSFGDNSICLVLYAIVFVPWCYKKVSISESPKSIAFVKKPRNKSLHWQFEPLKDSSPLKRIIMHFVYLFEDVNALAIIHRATTLPADSHFLYTDCSSTTAIVQQFLLQPISSHPILNCNDRKSV